MIQWIAPLASEAPELIVVVYLVNKARSTAGFNALISSKLNQWTLLIGTLVVVHSLALGRYGVLAFDFKQSAEIWLTAAQSFFAVSLLQSGSKSRSEKRSPCSFCSSRRSSSSSSSSEITRRCRSRAQSCCSSTARSTSSSGQYCSSGGGGRSAVSSSGRRGPSATRCRLAEIDHKASTTDTDCCKSVPVRPRYGLRSHR